jgi:hypothetical protein
MNQEFKDKLRDLLESLDTSQWSNIDFVSYCIEVWNLYLAETNQVSRGNLWEAEKRRKEKA